MSNLAPIVLFVYDRLDKTKKTINALQKNKLAKYSDLYIYSDAAKSKKIQNCVDEVRQYIECINGFGKVIIIYREKNWGLANSIIDGVTSIINKYGKVIVLEDDLVTSPYFLKYMNDALLFYKNKKKVWHISGWNYLINTSSLEDIFLWRLMNCWGWATWQDRWQSFEKNTDKIMDQFSETEINRFNLDGTADFWAQVIANKKKKINTWAIFWYATIFKNDGLCLNPTQTFVENIGQDGSGVHCKGGNSYCGELSTCKNIEFNEVFSENKIALSRIQKLYINQKKSILVRIINKVFRMFIKRNIIK
ncbi:MAG: sugar transferase [Candidatus Cloacimonadota bacterium]|nr:MAG: sugar transferase [Candidatus Cloacimonadota bacterium]